MFEVNLSLEKSDIAALNILEGQESMFRKAAARALNKTASRLKTRFKNQVSDSMDIKENLIGPQIIVKKARQNSLKSRVNLSSKGGVIRVNNLGKVKKNSTGVKVGSRQIDNAFQAVMPNGSTGVFRREDKSRLHIIQQTVVFTGRLAEFMNDANDGYAQRELQKIFIIEYRSLARAAQ